MNLTSHAAEAYRNKGREDQLRHEILGNLQAQRPDLFTPNSPLTRTVLNKPAVYQPPVAARQASTALRFGMLGMALHIGGGKKNEAGISTFASNGGKIEEFTLTQDEIEYIEAKQAWKSAKADPNVSESEKARLKARKQELKAGAKISKKRKERINTLLSLGFNLIPGPAGTVLGMVTKPVAVVAANALSSSGNASSSSPSEAPAPRSESPVRYSSGGPRDWPGGIKGGADCIVM